MDMSFYTAAVGAKYSLEKLSVVSNNLANINTNGFKPKTAVFSELINYNLADTEENITDLQAGAGMKIDRTNTGFSVANSTLTGHKYDFALQDANTFFAVQNPATGQITYTRDGEFHKGEYNGAFYLTSENGKLVLGENGQPLRLDENEDAQLMNLGVFTFQNPSRLLSIGDNEYQPAQGMTAVLAQDANVLQEAVEVSGTDITKELINLMEAQRAYSYALKMVTTSDEITQTINGLHG